jgi:hypothetical protein
MSPERIVMMPINVHQYREELKQALLVQRDQLATAWDVFAAAWLAYALSQDGLQGNAPLNEMAVSIQRWRDEEPWWEQHRHLGPIAFSCWLERQMGTFCDDTTVTRLATQVTRLRDDYRLSLLRDAEQVWLLALGFSALKDGPSCVEEATIRLIQIAKQQASKGPLRRRILYAAALSELGKWHRVSEPAHNLHDVEDRIVLVWWVERYGDGTKNDEPWHCVASMKERLALDPKKARATQRILFAPTLALLYEAVCRADDRIGAGRPPC